MCCQPNLKYVTEINPKCLRWSCSCSQWPLLWQRFSFWRLKIMVMVIVLYSAPSFLHIQNYARYKESIRMKQSPTTTPRTTCINVYLIYNTWWCMFIGLSIWKLNDKLFENCFDYIFLTIVWDTQIAASLGSQLTAKIGL